MKTFDRKDVYSWSNAEDAKQYIGEKGYFSDELKKNLKFWVKGTLKVINTDLKVSEVFAKENEEGDYPYGLFIPANKIKDVKEKKWRAFKNFKEFFDCTNKKLGSEITYRNKITSDTFYAVITRITVNSSVIDLGAHSYNLHELFTYHEWLNGDKWQPFGVEE